MPLGFLQRVKPVGRMRGQDGEDRSFKKEL